MPIIDGKPQSGFAKQLGPSVQNGAEAFVVLIVTLLDRNGLLDGGKPKEGPGAEGKNFSKSQLKMIKKQFNGLSPKDKQLVMSKLQNKGKAENVLQS